MLRQALSPTFLVILLGATVLWYISKLSNEYETEMSLNLRIDGQKYKPTVIIHGRGSDILARQLSLKSRLNFTLEELSPRPSRKTLGALTITPASLMKAINEKISGGLKVMEVVEAPEFAPQSDEKNDDENGDSDDRGSQDGRDGRNGKSKDKAGDKDKTDNTKKSRK